MRFLRGFMAQGTLLFVSHDSAAVVNLCQRALWLEKGNVRSCGDAKSVMEQYLAALYEAQQGESKFQVESTETRPVKPTAIRQKRDQRLDFINCSNLRNDLEVFSFAPDTSAFGLMGAAIKDVRFIDKDGNQLTWVVGSEEVSLEVEVQANQAIHGPIVGFYINDRLGQTLFGDNTYLTYQSKPITVDVGRQFVARFDFAMPILPHGQYTITVAIAEGTQEEHVQHHWMHDALLIESHSSSASTGLVGIPMHHISIQTLD